MNSEGNDEADVMAHGECSKAIAVDEGEVHTPQGVGTSDQELTGNVDNGVDSDTNTDAENGASNTRQNTIPNPYDADENFEVFDAPERPHSNVEVRVSGGLPHANIANDADTIFEGCVVDPNSDDTSEKKERRERKVRCIRLVSISLIIIGVVVIVAVVILKNRLSLPDTGNSDVNGESNNETLSPSSTFAPTSSLAPSSDRYMNLIDTIEELDISGRDVLTDVSTPQGDTIRYMAYDDPQNIPLNNTKKIVQRYALGTIVRSIATIDVIYSKYGDLLPLDECAAFECDEQGQVIGIRIGKKDLHNTFIAFHFLLE